MSTTTTMLELVNKTYVADENSLTDINTMMKELGVSDKRAFSKECKAIFSHTIPHRKGYERIIHFRCRKINDDSEEEPVCEEKVKDTKKHKIQPLVLSRNLFDDEINVYDDKTKYIKTDFYETKISFNKHIIFRKSTTEEGIKHKEFNLIPCGIGSRKDKFFYAVPTLENDVKKLLHSSIIKYYKPHDNSDNFYRVYYTEELHLEELDKRGAVMLQRLEEGKDSMVMGTFYSQEEYDAHLRNLSSQQVKVVEIQNRKMNENKQREEKINMNECFDELNMIETKLNNYCEAVKNVKKEENLIKRMSKDGLQLKAIQYGIAPNEKIISMSKDTLIDLLIKAIPQPKLESL